jgi:hypothetical protein
MPGLDNAHGLVIGIANYRTINPLPPNVLKDAQDVHDTLVNPNYCGYYPNNVQLLLDQDATGEAIRQALADLAARSDPDSNVFVYLSSHGGRVESGPHAGEYILPVDVDYASDEAIAQTAIAGEAFTEALRAVPARKVTILFDCCHSGGIGQPKDPTAAQIKVGLSNDYYDRLKQGRGRAILASSRSTEYSWILPGAENSLFTSHLLAGFKGGIASDDGMIRIFDLFEYIQPKVTLDQPDQHPIFKAEIEENFPVALYLGGQKGVVPQVQEGFRYDAYISYVDQEPDATWVWDTLVPKLEDAGLQIAISGDVEQPGVARVVNIERGMEQAKRTVIVLSETYMADNMADFENTLAQTMGIQEGSYRLLPVKIGAIDEGQLPTRLSMLTTLNMTHPRRAEREFGRLIRALQGPLPRR